jgi:glycosyltransferase involved in cell wall biosynthesis
VYGGASQRIKADVEALVEAGHKVEVIFPFRAGGNQAGIPAGLTLLTYPNLQGATLLPQKARMLFDRHTQRFSPFFRSLLGRRYRDYSAIFAHLPWSAAAALGVVKGRIPVIYAAHNFEYGLIRQATHNPVAHRVVYNTENYACTRAAKTLCVSQLEMNELERTYGVPANKLVLLPNTADVAFFSQTHTLYDRALERKNLGCAPSSFVLLFHGRMDYSGNMDALEFILRKLVPALSQSTAGETKLLIAGAQIPGWCLKYRNETVSVCPNVPDMRRLLSAADAVIEPLGIGGGTRLKILESFAAGVPVISSAKGAEGIACQNGTHILIAERTTNDFVRRITELAGNEELRRKLTANAYDLVEKRYGIHAAAKSLQDVIAQVTGR